MRRELEVQGLDKTLKRLKKVSDVKGQREIAKAGLRGAMKPIRAAMKAGAPRGETGILKRDIRYKVKVKNGEPYGIVGVFGQLSRGKMGGHEAPRSDLVAKWIEYGVSAHRIPKSKSRTSEVARLAFGGGTYSRVKHPGISPKPFLRPAIDTSMSQSRRSAEKDAHKKFRKLMAKR